MHVAPGTYSEQLTLGQREVARRERYPGLDGAHRVVLADDQRGVRGRYIDGFTIRSSASRLRRVVLTSRPRRRSAATSSTHSASASLTSGVTSVWRPGRRRSPATASSMTALGASDGGPPRSRLARRHFRQSHPRVCRSAGSPPEAGSSIISGNVITALAQFTLEPAIGVFGPRSTPVSRRPRSRPTTSTAPARARPTAADQRHRLPTGRSPEVGADVLSRNRIVGGRTFRCSSNHEPTRPVTLNSDLDHGHVRTGWYTSRGADADGNQHDRLVNTTGDISLDSTASLTLNSSILQKCHRRAPSGGFVPISYSRGPATGAGCADLHDNGGSGLRSATDFHLHSGGTAPHDRRRATRPRPGRADARTSTAIHVPRTAPPTVHIYGLRTPGHGRGRVQRLRPARGATINSPAAGATTDATPTFTFSGSVTPSLPLLDGRCRVRACGSPKSYEGLAQRCAHVRVKNVGTSGNAQSIPPRASPSTVRRRMARSSRARPGRSTTARRELHFLVGARRDLPVLARRGRPLQPARRRLR